MRHNPANPDWPDRDRFVLSAGHACILQYATLHLTGYDLSLEDLKQFRQWDSRTPGHPEHFVTAGVETTTGPLGQGFANGVGMAIAERFLAERYNRPHHEVVDHLVYAICSDGDLMEGVSHEAASIAGHLGLGRLVYVYDDNHITIDGTTSLTFTTEDKAKRFEAYGWHVQPSTTPRTSTRSSARSRAAQAERERPSLIVVRSHIAYGAPKAIDTAKAHGAPLGEEEVRGDEGGAGLDPDEHFASPTRSTSTWTCARRGASGSRSGSSGSSAGPRRSPALKEEWDADRTGEPRPGWIEALPEFPAGEAVATPRRRQDGDAGAEALHADDGRRRRRPRRVDEDRVRGRRALLAARTPAATSPSASASTRWARS